LRPDWQQKAPAEGYYSVNLASGEKITGKDFGNMLNSQLGSICGMKYNDLNGNGKRDEGEPGIKDWTILIGGTADFSVQTDENGEFCFTNLKPGVYKIGEQSRQGWIQTAPSSRYYVFELKGGEHITGQEFGNILDPKTGSICGMKFNDLNGNGILDTGEQGIQDWTINLSGSTTLTTQTDKSGNYCFRNLPAGEYTIAEGSRSGWYQTAPESGTYSFTLKPGESVTLMNFGNTKDPCYNETKSWSPLGEGENHLVLAVAMLGGDLYAGGQDYSPGAEHIAKWNGTSWTSLGSGVNGSVRTLAVIGTDLYVGGEFTIAGGIPANHIAKWDGANWSALGTGIGGAAVTSLEVNGTDLYVAGKFTVAGGVYAMNIAKWDGSSWSALGSGIGNSNNVVHALAASGTELYAGGWFVFAGGSLAYHIAKWDGTSWSALGNGISGDVRALSVIGQNVYAAGDITVASGNVSDGILRWDGTSWSALGSGVASSIWALSKTGSDLYVGGWITVAGGIPANAIAKWDGTSWSALGSGVTGSTQGFIGALTVSGQDLYAGGWFTSAGGITANNIAKYSCDATVSVGEVQLQQPFQLDQNYPNPFNSTSTIGYYIPQTSQVKIIVYDLYGKEIKVLVNEEKAPGHHEIVFDRGDFVSGIYFYTLKTAGFIQSRKMILMK